jgi:hypothetical protein
VPCDPVGDDPLPLRSGHAHGEEDAEREQHSRHQDDEQQGRERVAQPGRGVGDEGTLLLQDVLDVVHHLVVVLPVPSQPVRQTSLMIYS